MILTKTEINAAGLNAAGDILAFAYYVANTPVNYTFTSQYVYVRHTTLSTYGTATDETGTGYPNNANFTLVRQGDVTFNGGGWNEVAITAFNWDNTQNIEILWENRDNSWTSGYPTFRYTTATNTCVYKRQDSSFPASAGTRYSNRPHIKLITPSTTPPNAATLIYPGVDATVIGRNAILTWSLNGGGPTGVKVWLDTAAPAATPDPTKYHEVGTTVTSFDPDGLLAASQDYWWFVVPWNGNGDAGYTARKFTTGTGFDYAASTATSTADDDIGQFTLGAFANPATAPTPILSNPTAVEMYTNWTALGPIPVYKGFPTPVSITQITQGTTFYGTYVKVYIDYNQDGILDPVTEVAFEGAITSTTNPLTGLLTIPTSATLGTTRLRVVMRESGSTTTVLPTGTYSYGETEDYTVEILEPAVAAPNAPILAFPADEQEGLPKLGFNLTWNPDFSGGAGLPDYYTVYLYDANNDDLGYWETTDTFLNPLQAVPDPLTAFQYSQLCYWTVGAVVATFDEAVADLQSFRIEADPSIVYAALPYSTSFETAWVGTPPAPGRGWSVVNANSDSYTWRQGANYITPLTGAAFAVGMGNTNDWMITPAINTGVHLKLKWWDAVESASQPNSYKVMISTTDTLPASFTELTDITCTNTAWTEHSLDIDNTSGTIYLAFYQYASGSTYYGFGIDDLLLHELLTGPPLAPTLTYPLALTDLPRAGFNMTWTPNPTSPATDYYKVYMWKDSETMATGQVWTTPGTSLNPVNPPSPQTGITFAYLDHYNWTVEAFATAFPSAAAYPTASTFDIEDSPLVIDYIPYGDDFETHGDDSLPLGWTRSSLGTGWIISADYSSYYWTIPAHTVYAAANDDEANDDGSMDLLITPLFDLSGTGASAVELKFDSYYTGQYSYVATVEISANGGAWQSLYTVPAVAAWTGYSVPLTPYLAAPFQLRFHADDSGEWSSGWAIDNVMVKEISDYDAVAVSIDMPQVVDAVAMTPKATVINDGTQTITFNVEMIIGNEPARTSQVMNLAPGIPYQVSFSSFTPVVGTVYDITVTTLLTGDQVPANDVLESFTIALPLNVQAYADNAWDPVAQVAPGPCTFNLATPGTLTDLPAANPFGEDFLSGADWMNGEWHGTQYSETGSPYWNIDTVTGAGTLLGTGTLNMSGVAYDANNDIIYATDGTNLYTLSAIGVPTLIGGMTWGGDPFDGLFIGLAYDNLAPGILYGLDIVYNAVFTIDPATLAVTPLGYTVGYDLSYAQDMAFDQNSGLLYLSAYAGGGMLLWVNTIAPDDDGFLGDCYYVGAFQNGSEVDGFVIPYSDELPIPELSIAANGNLSWNDVGAPQYKIYSSADPYTGFAYQATVTGVTTWTDPNFSEAKKFYYVTAYDGAKRLGSSRITLNGAQNLKKTERVERESRRNVTTPVNSGKYTPVRK